MKDNNRLVPRLRFKEFSGDWEEKMLGDVGSFIGGGTPSTIDQNYWNGDILWLTPTEIKGGMVTDSIRKITKLGLENSSAKLLPIGAILITTRATIGDVGIASKPCTTNQGFQSLVVNIDQSNLFWYYWIIANKQELIRCASGSTFPEISKNEIKQIIALSPSFQEQQKIADTLSSLDTLIESEQAKLAKLQEHKKGLMQNLFPQEGESMPKVRFKEFENDGEWEEKELGDVGSFIGGGTPSTIDQNYWNGDILWLTPTEIKGGMVTDSIRKITKLGLENSSAKLLPIGAILITTRATIGDVGIASKPCTTNQGFQSLVVNIDQSNLFWYYWIIANKQELIRCASGSTFPEISKNEIKQIIALSPSFQEQQKIASTLSSLDNLISSQTERIGLLQQHKKGLMQGMFPMNNE